MGKTILIIKEEKMKKLKKVLALPVRSDPAGRRSSLGTAMGAPGNRKLLVAGRYEIDMADLPKVHFAEHPEWGRTLRCSLGIPQEQHPQSKSSPQPGEPTMWTKRSAI